MPAFIKNGLIIKCHICVVQILMNKLFIMSAVFQNEYVLCMTRAKIQFSKGFSIYNRRAISLPKVQLKVTQHIMCLIDYMLCIMSMLYLCLMFDYMVHSMAPRSYVNGRFYFLISRVVIL